LKKYFISSKKYFISLTKYFISSKKHSISLKQSFISLTKYSISLTKQRSLINNSTHFQFSRSYSSKKDLLCKQIHPDSGFYRGVYACFGITVSKFLCKFNRIFQKSQFKRRNKTSFSGAKSI